jgi:beta-mannosidase
MGRKEISRRECLSWFGMGAVSVVTPALGQSAAKPTATSMPNAMDEKISTQSELEELKELLAQRSFAPTPVQVRPDYTQSGQNLAGEQIQLRDGWELLGAQDNDPLGRYGLDRPWIPTTMPRPIQYALMDAGLVPNLWYGDNFKKLQWIQKRDWYLRRRFTIPESWGTSTIRLRFDGMDYFGMAWLDGDYLGSHEGSFGGPTFDISARVAPGKQHELLVRLVHEPHDLLMNFDSSSENRNPRVVKPDAQDAETYQWGNRYRTIGLYQPVRLVSTGPAYMEAPFVRTDRVGSTTATLWAQAMLSNTGTEIFDAVIEARIVEASTRKVVWQEKRQQKAPAGNSFWERELELENAQLWWPAGMGDQPLYLLELRLSKGGTQLDFISSRFGIRTLEIKRNPLSPDSPRATPSDRTLEDEAYKYLWVVNGRPFYAKGACWMTSDDIMLLSAEREEWMVRAAKHSGFNLLRLNGGTSIFETEQFYNLCDEHGIFVWQEVPLNWVDTPGTTSLGVWREQLTQTALRLRQHPSMAIYVGGNEFDPFADGIEPLLGLIREIFAGYDSSRAFRMNSPCGGDYHAYDPQDIYTADENWYHKLYDRGHNFISEWSFSSFANLSLLKRIIPESELALQPVGYDVEVFKHRYPTIRDRSAELWYTFIKSWQRASWYDDFGKADLERLIECSQMGYEHNIACVLEHWRAQFPYTGGEALWTYNSLGPISNSWHLIDWFGQPQIPFYAAKRANEPIHVMADTGFFYWGPGDTFKASVFGLNEGNGDSEDVSIQARIFDRDLRVVHDEQWRTRLPSNNRASEARNVEWPIPANTPEGYLFFELSLRDPRGALVSRRAYWLRIVTLLADPGARQRWQSAPVPELVTDKGPWLRPQVAATRSSLEATAKIEGQSEKEAKLSVRLTNRSQVPAYPVRVELLPDVYSVLWSDNFFWLAPGETVSIEATVRRDMSGLDPVAKPPIRKAADFRLRAWAWNAPALELEPR